MIEELQTYVRILNEKGKIVTGNNSLVFLYDLRTDVKICNEKS
jgi:hypothetical protein